MIKLRHDESIRVIPVQAWIKEEGWVFKLPPAWMETTCTIEQSSARGLKGSNHLFASMPSVGVPSETRWSRNGLWYTVWNNVIVLGSWFFFEGTQPGLHSHQIGAGELIDYTVNQRKLSKKKGGGSERIASTGSLTHT